MDNVGTTVSTIRRWIAEGKAAGATHVIVMRDTFDGTNYSLDVMPGQDVRLMAVDNAENMEKVVEVYNLALNIGKQLRERRAMNL